MADKKLREFTRRVAKMQKHVKALIELAPDDEQRETIYEMQSKLDWLGNTANAYFGKPSEGEGPQDMQPRKGPQPVAN